MRRIVVKLLKQLDPVPIENVVGVGTPDLNTTLGWIELKQATKWPGGEGSLRMKHFTNEQKIWLKHRIKADGHAWVLLHVDGDWLLLWGTEAVKLLGQAGREELIAASDQHWTSQPSQENLIQCLLSRHRP